MGKMYTFRGGDPDKVNYNINILRRIKKKSNNHNMFTNLFLPMHFLTIEDVVGMKPLLFVLQQYLNPSKYKGHLH